MRNCLHVRKPFPPGLLPILSLRTPAAPQRSAATPSTIASSNRHRRHLVILKWCCRPHGHPGTAIGTVHTAIFIP